jgi:hypothetical protein
MHPKVLVGCPTWGGKAYILNEYAAALKALDYENFDVLIIDNSPDERYMALLKDAGLPAEHIDWIPSAMDRIIASRNVLRQRFLEGNYDYFLSLEQDVLAQPETIKTLLAHKKDFVTTLVLNNAMVEGKRHIVPMISVDFPGRPGQLRYITGEDIKQGSLIPVKQSHLACTLLSRQILEKFSFRHDEEAFDDTCLCEDLLGAGFTLWCDTTLRPVHRPSDWSGIRK